MQRSGIVSALRTPADTSGSALRSRSAVDLGAVAIGQAVARASVAQADVDYVVMVHVLQAGADQITSRQAAIGPGF